jgi:hypothetical protein
VSRVYSEAARASTSNGHPARNGKPPAWRQRPIDAKFIRLYADQLAIPRPQTLADYDGAHLTDLEFRLVVEIACLDWLGDGITIDRGDLAKLIGLTASDSHKDRVSKLLHGRQLPLFRTVELEAVVPGTGEKVRLKQRVKVGSVLRPGLCSSSRGWILSRGGGKGERGKPHPPLKLGITACFMEWGLPPITSTEGQNCTQGRAPSGETTPGPNCTQGRAPLRESESSNGSHVAPKGAHTEPKGAHTEPKGARPCPIVEDSKDSEDPTFNVDVQRVSESEGEQRKAPPAETTEAPPEAPRPTQSKPSVPRAESTAPAPPAAPRPAEAQLREVLGDHHFNSAPGIQAGQLRDRLDRRGVHLEVTTSETGPMLKPRFDVGRHDELTEADKAVMKWLKSELLTLLHSERATSAEKQAEQPATGNGSGAVPSNVVKGLKARVANLVSNPAADDSDCQALADDLVKALRDRGSTSRETFTGIARDVKSGNLSTDAFAGVVHDACASGIKNRGARLIKGVKDLRADMHARTRA